MDYNKFTSRQHAATRFNQPWIIISLCVSVLIVAFTIWRNTSENSGQQLYVQPLSLPTVTLPNQNKNDNTNTITKNNWQTITIKSGDTLEKIFNAQGIATADAIEIAQLGKETSALSNLKLDQHIKLLINRDKQLQELIYPVDNAHILIVTQTEQGYQAEINSLKLEPRQHYVMGVIHSSFSAAAQKAGLTKAYVSELNHAFGSYFNFAHDARPGDRFTVIYQNYYSADKKVKDGPIIAAEIRTPEKTYRIVRFQETADKAEYFTARGHSLRIGFLRAPLKYTRIASAFNLHRYQPILHIYRPHKGVDLDAPRGSPIHAASNGRIIFMGREGGFGNLIKIQHTSGYQTFYAHLAHFARSLKVGSRVKEDQVIGYVGSTGLATGPHLHYEFHVNGQAVNPMKVKLPLADPVPRKYRYKFLKESHALIAQLDLYQSAQLAASSGRHGASA